MARLNVFPQNPKPSGRAAVRLAGRCLPDLRLGHMMVLSTLGRKSGRRAAAVGLAAGLALSLTALPLLAAATASPAPAPTESLPRSVAASRPPARAIILFIGDGLGEAQRTAARWSAVGQTGALAMDALPAAGWARTAPLSATVTDSAAAATALATGQKTVNRKIGVDPDDRPLLTILERARDRGWAVGLVTTTQLAHATPAAFAAHVPDRAMMTEIARQMIAAEVDVLLGGGEDEFLPPGAAGCYPEPGERDDGRNLIAEATAAGYTYVCRAAELAAVDPAVTPRLLGLFADEGLARPFAPSLAEMTQRALELLAQDPDGFLLMVEGGQIDWAAHVNNATNVISDTLGLDEAVGVALAYAAGAPHTLVVVTGDHETGGMSADLTSSGRPDEDGPFAMPDGTPFYVNWTTTGHTAADVPTTAQGPWSDLLDGAYENTHIHEVMRLALESAPALTLVKAALPPAGSTVAPGQRITYTIAAANTGQADATGLILTDTLDPAKVALLTAGATAGALHISGSNLVRVSGFDLPGGAAMTVTLGVQVAASPTKIITDAAALASEQTGPGSSNVVYHWLQGVEVYPVHLPVVFKALAGPFAPPE